MRLSSKSAFLLRLLIYLVILLLAYCWKSSQLIIAPKRFRPSWLPSYIGMDYEDVAFRTSDHIEIKGWFIPALNPRGTIILCHGYGTNRGDCLEWAKFLHDHGYSSLLFDFRGHGESEGKYCSLGYYETKDLRAAIRFAKKREEDSMGAMGFSMGGTVALMVAAEDSRLAAVVTDGAYLSFHSVVGSFARKYFKAPKYPFIPPAIWAAGLRLHFNPEDVDLRQRVGSIAPRPILIVHGEEDREVLLSDAEAIYRAAGEPKELWLIPGADHSTTYAVDRESYEQKVLEFFDRAIGRNN